jgi:hypothetical protein
MKKFLIIGNVNAISYKEVFPLLRENKIWLGVNPKGGSRKGDTMGFVINDEVGYVPAWWYTNIDHNKRNIPLKLTKSYNATDYPKYDNYDAIEVSKTCDIPLDYDGVMGVPISFLDKYCPEQFEIIKFRKGDDDKDLSINGKCPYFRVLIKSK